MFNIKNLKLFLLILGVLFWTMGLFAIAEQITFLKAQATLQTVMRV